MNNKNIGVLIPIRLTSERLPGKALREICGRPVAWHLLDRACASKYVTDPKQVVVCTTEEPESDPLVESVERYGCSAFRGSTDDIIERFHSAFEAYGFDAVIQADGDDPLSATEYMDLEMDMLMADPSLDIVTSKGLPLGVATKAFTRSAMNKVYRQYRTSQNDTGFIYFFTKTDLCKQGHVYPQSPGHVHEKARLTLDYQVDFEVFTSIFEALYKPGEVFGLSEVVEYLNAHPRVVEHNLGVDEEYWQRDREKAQLTYVADDGSLKKV